jgi:hypothetical protein
VVNDLALEINNPALKDGVCCFGNVSDSGFNTFLTALKGGVLNPSHTIKVMGNFAENTSTKLIGIVPVLVNDNHWQIAVKTQFTGSSNKFLKTPRIITNDIKLEAAWSYR